LFYSLACWKKPVKIYKKFAFFMADDQHDETSFTQEPINSLADLKGLENAPCLRHR